MAEGGESALVAQQKFAAEEPYKDIEANQATIKSALSAFAVGAEVNKKRQQLENQLAGMSLKQMQMEHDRELDAAKFGLAVQKMELDYGAKGTMAEIARERMQNQYEHQGQLLNWKMTQDDQRDSSVAGVAQGMADLAAEGITQGHPDYYKRVNEILAANPNLPNSQANQVRRGAGLNQNAAAREQRMSLNDDFNRFNTDIGRRFYGGNTTVQDLDSILNPDRLPDATEPVEGSWWGATKKKEGYKVIKGLDAQQQPKDIPVAVTELQNLKKQWQALQTRQQGLTPFVNRPDLGVTASLPMPSDKSLLRPSVVYSTPRGDMRWTGTGFVPP